MMFQILLLPSLFLKLLITWIYFGPTQLTLLPLDKRETLKDNTSVYGFLKHVQIRTNKIFDKEYIIFAPFPFSDTLGRRS